MNLTLTFLLLAIICWPRQSLHLLVRPATPMRLFQNWSTDFSSLHPKHSFVTRLSGAVETILRLLSLCSCANLVAHGLQRLDRYPVRLASKLKSDRLSNALHEEQRLSCLSIMRCDCSLLQQNRQTLMAFSRSDRRVHSDPQEHLHFQYVRRLEQV